MKIPVRSKQQPSGRYGNSVTFDYDLVGRKTEEVLTIGSDSFTVGTDYDELSRVDEITYPNNKKVERQYNSRGLLEQVKYDGSIVDTRLYNDVGRLETSTYGNGVVTQFGYLDDNRVQSIATTNNGTQKVGTYSYTYDLNGNKTAETISGGGVSNDFGFSTGQSGYDADDRLVGWNRSDGDRDHSWNLSPVGDWNSLTESSSSGAPTTTSYSHSDSHETIAIDNATIGYDADGNRLTANNGTDIYDWDFDNKLACVGDHSFEFDALGRRVAISVAGETSILVCNDQQLIAVYSLGSGTSQPPGGMPPGPPMPLVATLDKVFVFGSYIDEPLMMMSGSDKYYFSRNQQFSVTALTNVGGQVAERYAYDAYGKTQILSASGTMLADSSFGNPFMFTGRYNHSTLDLMYFRARMYDMVAGNFISQDPLGFVDGMSQYRAYFVPNGVDPNGLACQPPNRHGANYIPGRGQFSVGSPSWGVPDGISGPFKERPLQENAVEPMWIEAKWQPNMAAFKDSKGCCCCDEISWSQIIKEKRTFSGFAALFMNRDTDWEFDGGVDYSEGTKGVMGSGNPCVFNGLEIVMGDQPYQTGVNSPIGNLQELTLSYETCVYCKSGTEGLRTEEVLKGRFFWEHKKLTVYACFSWGFSTKRQKDGTYTSTYSNPKVKAPNFDAWRDATETLILVTP